MAPDEKAIYDILWYLNEYPSERNAVDEIIISDRGIDEYNFARVKPILIREELIKQREDNENNIAWKITDKGIDRFLELKQTLRNDDPDLADIDDDNKRLFRENLQLQNQFFKRSRKDKLQGLRWSAGFTILGAIIGILPPMIYTRQEAPQPYYIVLPLNDLKDNDTCEVYCSKDSILKERSCKNR